MKAIRPAVQLKGLAKKYGAVVAVDDLTLDIHPGEFFSLLGPSGCGKTTTLRIIAGLTSQTAGNVLINGDDVGNLPVYKRNIGMVFQNYALFPHMSIRENVAFGLFRRGIAKTDAYKRVTEMLDLVQLPGVQERYPSQLSGGQQQRVSLARALAPNPEVLLLDEPLSNLDLKLRQDLRVELKRIQKEVGITTVFVTHDQGEALSLSDRIAIMKEGRLVQIGTPIELYEEPRNNYVASFLGDANFFRGVVSKGRLESEGWMIASPKLLAWEGKSVEIALRSERIIITDPGRGLQDANIGRAVVETSIYLGAVTRYYVRLIDGKLVLVDTVQRGDFTFPDGAEVTIQWDAEDCMLVEEGLQNA